MPFAKFQLFSSLARTIIALLARHRRASAAIATALTATTLIAVPPAQAAAYQNPFAGETPLVGRTDMGVDLCLTTGEPIRAVGDGVVAGVERNWFEREPYSGTSSATAPRPASTCTSPSRSTTCLASGRR